MTCVRLARLACDVDLDLTLFLDNRRVKIGCGQRRRVYSRDVHRNLLAEGFVFTGQRNQNTDLAHAVCGSVVDVGQDLSAFENRHAAHGHVFTDGGDLVGDGFFDGLATDDPEALSASTSDTFRAAPAIAATMA